MKSTSPGLGIGGIRCLIPDCSTVYSGLGFMPLKVSTACCNNMLLHWQYTTTSGWFFLGQGQKVGFRRDGTEDSRKGECCTRRELYSPFCLHEARKLQSSRQSAGTYRRLVRSDRLPLWLACAPAKSSRPWSGPFCFSNCSRLYRSSCRFSRHFRQRGITPHIGSFSRTSSNFALRDVAYRST